MPARLVSQRALRPTLGIGLATLLALTVQACSTLSIAPPTRTTDAWTNPLRGDAASIDAGAVAYAQSCARCHGKEATQPGPAANLRLIGRYCGRLDDPTLKQRCTEDADAYFLKSVEDGKVRLDVRHMPGWKGQLSTEQVWAIQAYVESRRK